MARLHPVAAQMFSKDMLVPLPGHMPFCLELYQELKQSQSYSTSQTACGKCCQRYTQLNWGLLGSSEEIHKNLKSVPCLQKRDFEALKKDNEAVHQVLWSHLSLQEATKSV